MNFMQGRRISSAFVYFALMLSLGLSVQSQVVSSLQGTISAKGAGVPNAAVLALNTSTQLIRTTQSNAQGFFFLPNLPVGHYEITVMVSGFAAIVAVADVTPAAAILNIDILAPEQHGQITVRILDSTGNPVPNVQVSIESKNGESYHGVTDQDGKWTRSSLSGGKYIISTPGSQSRSVRLADNGEKTIELKVKK
jgi:hypothetical protein